jgi:hypothetical protein
VLGCGIDRDYPRAHTQLASLIAADGLILSEYSPGVEPAPWRFPLGGVKTQRKSVFQCRVATPSLKGTRVAMPIDAPWLHRLHRLEWRRAVDRLPSTHLGLEAEDD